jgi:molybdate transport system substrate-binding protein
MVKLMTTAFALLIATCTGSHAAEIRVLGTQSMVLVWNEIAASFESQTGHKVVMTPHIAAAAKKMIDAGERFDVAILSPGVIDQLIKENKVAAETRVDIMRVGIAVAVRAGQPKPDITSVEAFKAALLKAGSIAYLKTGVSGVYLSKLMQRLDIADQLKSKTKTPEEDIVGPMVARGEAELGITAMSTLLATPGLEVVGPIPAEIQNYVIFTGAISSASPAPEAGRALLNFLTSPAAVPAMRAKGLQPG